MERFHSSCCGAPLGGGFWLRRVGRENTTAAADRVHDYGETHYYVLSLLPSKKLKIERLVTGCVLSSDPRTEFQEIGPISARSAQTSPSSYSLTLLVEPFCEQVACHSGGAFTK
jgi:hypothetical protein